MITTLIICWMISNGEIHEQWRVEKQTTPAVCMKLNQIMSGGGRLAVITVTCGHVGETP